MLVLDTDHFSELEVRSVAGMRLLTRNSKDFSKVPRLKFANWLDA